MIERGGARLPLVDDDGGGRLLAGVVAKHRAATADGHPIGLSHRDDGALGGLPADDDLVRVAAEVLVVDGVPGDWVDAGHEDSLGNRSGNPREESRSNGFHGPPA